MADKKKGSETVGAVALHGKDKERHHVVGLGNIRVLILQDEQFWFAQGVEIDYGAQGDSVEDAKKNFQQGLAATVDLHLRMHGTIEKLLEFAPSAVLRDAARMERFSQVLLHDIGIPSCGLPFNGIDYYRLAREGVT